MSRNVLLLNYGMENIWKLFLEYVFIIDSCFSGMRSWKLLEQYIILMIKMFCFGIESNGIFSVKSMYVWLILKGLFLSMFIQCGKLKFHQKFSFFSGSWLIGKFSLEISELRDIMLMTWHAYFAMNLKLVIACSLNALFLCHLGWGCKVSGFSWFVHLLCFVADLWNSNKRNVLANDVTASVLWTLGVIRNGMCFNHSIWPGMHVVYGGV
jgi:hypothetical protein